MKAWKTAVVASFALSVCAVGPEGGAQQVQSEHVASPAPQASPSPVGPASPQWVATPEPEPSPRHRITRLPVCIRGVDEKRYPPELPPDPPTEDEDPDKDGAHTRWDNCPATWNPDQKDSDEDGLGDACTDPDERHPIVCIDTPVSVWTSVNPVVARIGVRADARRGAPIVELRFVDGEQQLGTAKPVQVAWVGRGVVEAVFTWTAPPPGRHLIQVVAVAADGVEGRSEPVVLVVKDR
jgi:hypothetical protein